MTADQVPHREADSNEDEAIVMQLTLLISDDSWYFPLFRPHNTARPTSTRLERDPLGPSFLRRLEARGSSKKGVTAHRYQLEAMLKIAESIIGESVTLEHIFNDLRLLGKVLISDVAPRQSEQLSKWSCLP